MPRNLRHNLIGPFQFLVLSLIVSEGLLVYWMSKISDNTIPTNHYERIVVGSFSITVLIAVLVIFTVIYYIKKKHNDFNK